MQQRNKQCKSQHKLRCMRTSKTFDIIESCNTQQFNGDIVKANPLPTTFLYHFYDTCSYCCNSIFWPGGFCFVCNIPWDWKYLNFFWCLDGHISFKMGRVILEYIHQPSPTVTDNSQKGSFLTGAASYTTADKITFFCTILLPMMLHHLVAIKLLLSALPLAPLLLLTRSPVVLLTCLRLSRSTSVN